MEAADVQAVDDHPAEDLADDGDDPQLFFEAGAQEGHGIQGGGGEGGAMGGDHAFLFRPQAGQQGRLVGPHQRAQEQGEHGGGGVRPGKQQVEGDVRGGGHDGVRVGTGRGARGRARLQPALHKQGVDDPGHHRPPLPGQHRRPRRRRVARGAAHVCAADAVQVTTRREEGGGKESTGGAAG